MRHCPAPDVTNVSLGSAEAAEYLRLKPSTLLAMRMDGTGLPYYKVGPVKPVKVIYKPEDLDGWLGLLSYQSTSEYGRD